MFLTIRGYKENLQAVLSEQSWPNLHKYGHCAYREPGYVYHTHEITAEFETYRNHRQKDESSTMEAVIFSAQVGAEKITGDWYGDGWAVCVPCSLENNCPIIYDFVDFDDSANAMGFNGGYLKGTGTSQHKCPCCDETFSMFEGK